MEFRAKRCPKSLRYRVCTVEISGNQLLKRETFDKLDRGMTQCHWQGIYTVFFRTITINFNGKKNFMKIMRKICSPYYTVFKYALYESYY